MKKSINNLFIYLDIPIEKKNIILDTINIFLPSDQDILKKKCGPNYIGEGSTKLSKEENVRLHSVIVPRLRTSYVTLSAIADPNEYQKELAKLKENFNKMRRMNSISNLIAYFANLYSYEELDAVVKSLKEEEQSGIYAVCGPLLNGENTKEDTLTKEERSRVNTHYMPKIKNRLKKLYPDRQVPKEDITPTETTSKLPETIQEEPTYPVDVVIKDEIGFTKKDYLDIVKIFNSPEFKELMRLNLPLEEIIVASLIHHGYGNKTFTIEDITKFLGVDRETIIAIAKKSTEEYRQAINQKIDEYEGSLLKLMIDDDGVK